MARISNPERLILALDEGLDHEVRLVLYGRASIALGFNDPPPETADTLDVDVIIQLSQLDELVDDEQFWDSRDAVNVRFKDEGLYITHLFQEDQVFLREGWEREIVPVLRPDTRFLRLFRPATIDLILTKMMRGNDRQDMDDVTFLVRQGGVTMAELEAAFACVRIPDVLELHEAFERAEPEVRRIVAAP
jgi:hypothetical protein